MDAVGELLALPEQVAGLLVQGHQVAAWAAGGKDHAIAVDQRHAGIAPLGQFAAEILGVVLSPTLFSVWRRSTQTTSPYCPTAKTRSPATVGVQRGPAKAAPAGAPALPTFVFQSVLPSAAVDADHVIRVALVAHGEHRGRPPRSRWCSRCPARWPSRAAWDRRRAIAFSRPVSGECPSRLRAAPLRPIGRRQRRCTACHYRCHKPASNHRLHRVEPHSVKKGGRQHRSIVCRRGVPASVRRRHDCWPRCGIRLLANDDGPPSGGTLTKK